MNQYESMANEQLVIAFQQYWKITGVSRSHIGFYVRNHNKELYDEIVHRTIKLNQYKRTHKGVMRDVSIFERIYCIKHQLDDRPLCIECHINHCAGFVIHQDKYADYCSQNCQKHSSIQAQKGIETKKIKYGEDNITNNKKARQTRIDRYGSYHSNDYASKVKATKKRRYGDENYTNVEKMKQTVEQHKKENPNYYYDREQKTKQTKIANGHDPNWNNRTKFKDTLSSFSDEKRENIKQKRKQTCLNDYGVESVAQLQSVKMQRKNTCLSKYGKESFLATEQCQSKSKMAKKKQAWKYFNEECKDIVPVFTEDEFVSCDLNEKQKIWKWKCKKCGHEFNSIWANWHQRRCPKCHPQNYRGMQTEVEDFVRSICIGHNVIRDCKSVLKDARQLDIYIPDMNVAIEFNGVFWHNSDISIYGRQPTLMMYHYNKSTECASKGIRLVHIFEDEWRLNAKLCKSKLKKILCPMNSKHIDARNCLLIKEVDSDIKHKFLCKYAFDGDDGSSIQYGLSLNDHLVAMMTFSKTRNNKQYEWQILNYVEVNSFIVDGGFNILFNTFVVDHSPKSISMYASRDWIVEDDFKLSFDNACIKRPRLYWAHEGCRIRGTSISKSNASKVLPSYDASKPFLSNMNTNGYFRIYDSGIVLFEKSFA